MTIKGKWLFRSALILSITINVIPDSFAQDLLAQNTGLQQLQEIANTITGTSQSAAQPPAQPTAEPAAVPTVSAPPPVPAATPAPTETPVTTVSAPPPEETAPPAPVSSTATSVLPTSPEVAPPIPQQVPVGSTPPAPPAAAQAQSAQGASFNAWLRNNGYVEEVKTTTTTTTQARPGRPVYYSQSLTNRPARPRFHPPSPTFEEGQRAMLETAPRGRFQPDADSNLAFNAMLRQNMPLAPKQVVELRQQIDVAQRAASIPANIPPKPVSTTLMVNLAPGTTPPAVRLAQGYVSSLVFVDSTGTPWPIAAFDIGNPKAVNIQWDGKSNILILQAVSPYMDGDIVIRLVGLPTPVTLELVSGQRVVDYRVDIHVPGIGPNTKDLPIGIPLPGSANELLLGVLDGVAPAGSKLLSIIGGGDCNAWLLGERIYLRTRLTVLSPGWTGKMVSPDGMQAYELPKTSSVLVSRYGEPAELKIEGF